MLYETNYLEHHGIKGQKWGSRRFQNEDGTLTAEGRDRYGVGESNAQSQFHLRDKKRNPASPMNNKLKTKAGATQEIDSKKKEAEDLKKQKRRDVLKKIGIGLGATALTAIAAHAVSKNIKNKANSILQREHSTELNRIMRQHDILSKNVSSSGYGTDAVNRILDDLRNSTNAKLKGQSQYRDYQRDRNNKSTLESLRYIRSHK